MKLRIRFKDPDLIGDYIAKTCPGSYDDEAVEMARDGLAALYFEYGDYGMVEIDTDAGTGRLVPLKEWNKR